MGDEILVRSKGQTTIPARLRKKYRIRAGTRLEVTDSGDGILLKPKPSTVDLAGSGSTHSNPREMKRLLDRMRAEDFCPNDRRFAGSLTGFKFEEEQHEASRFLFPRKH